MFASAEGHEACAQLARLIETSSGDGLVAAMKAFLALLALLQSPA
jgi:hypothetical protein